MCIGIVIILGALPALLLGEVWSEKFASWRSDIHRERLLQQDAEWEDRQRSTVCVTEDNVSYDFEFAGTYEKYETAVYALRDNAPQSIRDQAADIISNRIERAYTACKENRITPLAEREQLKAAFSDFIQLAVPYSKQ